MSHDSHDNHSHDDNHGHGGHGHGENEKVELIQEKLLGTMITAAVFVAVAMIGLFTAGGTSVDIKMGKSAYDKVKSEMSTININKSGHNDSQKPDGNHSETENNHSPEETDTHGH